MRLRLWSRLGEQRFAPAPIAVGPRHHQVAGLGRDDQFVAMAAKVGAENVAESGLGRAWRRSVGIGEIEMGDARSNARRQIAHFDSGVLSKPKLCHRPSEIAGSFSPLRPLRLNTSSRSAWAMACRAWRPWAPAEYRNGSESDGRQFSRGAGWIKSQSCVRVRPPARSGNSISIAGVRRPGIWTPSLSSRSSWSLSRW